MIATVSAAPRRAPMTLPVRSTSLLALVLAAGLAACASIPPAAASADVAPGIAGPDNTAP